MLALAKRLDVVGMRAHSLPRSVIIEYKRLPNELRQFHGVLREETPNLLVVEQKIKVDKPRRAFGEVVAANGYLAIWCIFRSKWYDIAKFYDRKLRFKGYYCDIIKPVPKLLRNKTRTAIITDLFLDLWITPEGRYLVLDEDELGVAIRKHAISNTLAKKARKQLNSLVQLTKSGRFPTASVRELRPPRRRERI